MHGADVEVELAGSIGHNALEFLEHNFFERLAEGHFVQCDEQLPLRTLRKRLSTCSSRDLVARKPSALCLVSRSSRPWISVSFKL